ncbi:DUF1064 domain-containing protein [Escherichia coli]|nr:DUF1064 domain-containing protein [Escherichia coli]
MKLLRKAGRVVTFLMQVPFHLPGGVVYKLDFMVFYDDGTIDCVDTKGVRTDVYIMKKKAGRGALSRHDTGDLNSETRSG